MSGMTYLSSGGSIGPNPNHGGYYGGAGPGAGTGYGGAATSWGSGGVGGTNMNNHFSPGSAGKAGVVVVRYPA
jgi:hypothetical protein